ncbi:kinase-like protein [Fistulina hepatica ATCC 64428]|uniref:Kinase-like protein n=1 Tax=Fistulina hepatica ATCC 64428 TaxID=1128425 RepID=A0A0D7A4S6_9AGAR|nr:kinase-like protein [Fistulina hepatica ATCC 64428]
MVPRRTRPFFNKDSYRTVLPSNICARLLTTTKNGRKEVIYICLGKAVTVGRNPRLCVRSPTGGVLVSCQDLSRNGIVINGNRIKRTPVILSEGDQIEIPSSQTFKCVSFSKDPNKKIGLFDPTPPQQPVHKKIGRYIVTSKCLGSGTFATVHLAHDSENYRQVACKTIRTKKQSEISQVMKEAGILMSLNHPNINKVYSAEQDENFLHIFLQLCTGGDLFTYITDVFTRKRTRICEAEVKYIMYQLFQGIKYLHDQHISHRDLKPENVLLYCPGPYPRVLIADFGLARPNAYQETFNVCGTVSYLPPEGILALARSMLIFSRMPSDCWSAGVIMFIMMT